MRRIVYAGASFYTGDDIAAALLDYAVALARVGSAATASFPARTTTGILARLDVVFGTTSQIVSEPVELCGTEIVDRVAVSRLKELTSRLGPRVTIV
ncbi:hypothetical protein ACF1AJ_11225 [Leifsonia sp. NPDC014704]|uniref:hypothetical protein n=1 Tax=Leifsonia sp. NPDC014704 TaxID=3364123 RepID=UPI0036F4506B